MLLSGPELAFAMGAVFLSSAVAGLVGFGMGMMLSPMLLLVLDPPPVVLAVNTLSFVGLAMIGVKGRGEVDVGSAKPLVIAGLTGVPVGLLVLENLAPESLKILIGVVIVVLAALSLSRRRIPIPKSKLVDAAFGFSGAALVTGLGVGIPIVAWHLFNQGLGGEKNQGDDSGLLLYGCSLCNRPLRNIRYIHRGTMAAKSDASARNPGRILGRIPLGRENERIDVEVCGGCSHNHFRPDAVDKGTCRTIRLKAGFRSKTST